MVSDMKKTSSYGLLPAIIVLFMLFSGCFSGKYAALPERFSDGEKRLSGADAIGDIPYLQPGAVVMDNFEYVPNIRSVKLFKEDIELSMPLINLGSDEKLTLIFDDLDGVYKEYQYTIVHCDASWNPSGIPQVDYLDGFFNGVVRDYAFSQATRQPYVHFRLQFPGDDFSIKRSGNYVISVYPASQPEQIVLTRRFMICEPKITITAYAKKSTVVEEQRYRQEIDFEINKATYQIDNPYNDLFVVVQQNGRWDNAILDIKPKLVLGNRLSYDWEKINVFDGTNEYRHVDLRSLNRLTPRIAMIERDSFHHHVFVKPDFKRAFQVYLEDKDLNGAYIIYSDDALNNHHTEADYAWVHFSFPYQSPFDHGAVYLFGELTNWQFPENARMMFNEKKKTYEASLYLKQGYYNYHYVMLDNAGRVANTFLTEGDHYETENFYTIYVYHRQPGSDYDRLIGVERIIAPQQR